MNNNYNATKPGISAADLLQIAFIVLKLCNVIQWKWIWVLAPEWISITIFVVVDLIINSAGDWRSK